MFLSSRQRNPRRGVILLVVLALITLFASIGVAFVYFAEAEATKAQDQKAGETVKLPDADLMFNYVLRQLVFPTTNNSSALYTQSLLENMYGRTNGNTVQNVVPFNGTGWRANFDPATGQDNLYRRNMQYLTYDESVNGSLNPTYTYPDHKNPYLGGVAANYRQPDYGTHLPSAAIHGPVAIARSWAREMKFRVAIQDTTSGTTVGYQEIILNPYSNAVFPSGARHQDFWKNQATLVIGNLPALPGGQVYLSNTSITMAGLTATLQLNAPGIANHALRPTARLNPNFPPPSDNGGDVKCLPPEVKTLVGFDAANNPVFANNDSYWMDVGFPAMQWSNNRKVKPLVAMFIMDNDGKVNLNTAGNNRAMDLAGQLPYHVSAHGLSPSEINPTKLTESFNAPLYGQPLITTATIRSELAAFMGGFYSAASGPTVLRGRFGYTSLGDGDPTTAAGTYPTSAPVRATYSPIFRPGSPYAPYNLDGTCDGFNATTWYKPSFHWQLSGDFAASATDPLYIRFPYFSTNAAIVPPVYGYNVGYNGGNQIEFQRGGVNRSPFFFSPFADSQPSNNADSGIGAGSQRTFGPQNHEELYRTRDSGGDKFNGELRKLIPSSYTTAQQRWQQTLFSNDLSVAGIAPWFSETPPPTPQYYTYPLGLPGSTLTNGGGGNSQALPGNASVTGEFFSNANYSWRSIFANVAGSTVNSFDRIDLSRQLPDYPLPANNNTALDLANPIVRAQYMIALQARQRMAREIYNSLVTLMRPNDDPSRRYVAQLAVNMVDYIDNDDYPTWFTVPAADGTIPASLETNTVWGTELPRLVINEAYSEAVNNSMDMFPGGRASKGYDVHHWVELYNPLTNSNYPSVWPYHTAGTPSNLDAEARLNVGGTSAYRLILTRPTNITKLGDADNNTGQPDSFTDTKVCRLVTFAADETVLPSDGNYGNGTTAVANNGFYLVGPPNLPKDAATGAVVPPAPPNFPNANYSKDPTHTTPGDVDMIIEERITTPDDWTTVSTDNNNREVVLLQRLANPYLPYNPLLPDPASNPMLPYNPYITIDVAKNLTVNKAIDHDKNGTTVPTPVDQRYSEGKLQPYASYNDIPTGGTTPLGLWIRQRPDRENTNTTRDDLLTQPQHTFLRHNGVETDQPAASAAPRPQSVAKNTSNAALTNEFSNTMRLPFDWLVHLDRAPTSPAELLHVSGFKPHELTQKFNQLTPVITATASTGTLAPGTAVTVTAGAGFIGQDHGTPYSLRNNDLVYVTWISPTAGNQSEWVVATSVNIPTSGTFVAQTNLTVTGVTAAQVQLVIPFAHYAPWYRALQNVNINSSSRLYRFLETVAVRNPGVDVGQYRFTSNVPTVSAGGNTPQNISAPLAPASNNYSRWIQLDHGTITGGNVGLPNLTTTRVISTNDALLNIRAGDPVFGGELNPIGGYNGSTPFSTPSSVTDTNYNVGDTVVINAGSASVNVPEQRATILEIDRARNCIRVVLSVPAALAAGPISEPLTIDYTYVSGRQPGKININTIWDRETFWALADAQPMNGFYGPLGNRDLVVDNIFTRLQQQRQPQYYYGPRMVGHTGFYGSVPEDRPFQGMGTGDIAATIPAIPQQGIGNTFLSDRYQERASGFVPYPVVRSDPALGDMTSPVGGDNGDLHRFTRTLFEIGNPGQDHPYRRFELLSKIWNNMTVRSNTFTVWMTIGFFEYDDTTGLGAELGQIQGKNTRYRFFAVIDRTTIDRWLQNWALHDSKAGINTLMDSNLFPNLDPRYATFPNLTAISTNYSPITTLTGKVNGMAMPQTWSVQISPPLTNPFYNSDGTAGGRMVYVESSIGGEYAQVISQTATAINLQLTLNHSGGGVMTIRPLPVPPTVLHWTQMK